MKIDKIIISSNDHKDYLPFIKIVGPAWKKLMGITPTFLYVSDNPEHAWMDEYVDVIVVPNHPRIPSGNHAMATRMLMATQFGDQVCMLSDIDMLPLGGHKYFSESVKNIPSNNIVFIGGNAYTDPFKFPICYMIGKGSTFGEILNPRGSDYAGLLEDMLAHPGSKPQCSLEYPVGLPHQRFDDEDLFSDFYRAWEGRSSRTVEVFREWDRDTNVASGRVDRALWSVDMPKLLAGDLVDSHMLRPMPEHKEKIKELTDALGIVWPENMEPC